MDNAETISPKKWHQSKHTDILYASISIQGLGLKNLFVNQGIIHVCDIIEHTWMKIITGHFIQMSLESLRIELGINQCILQANYYDYQDIILTSSWLQFTWKFMTDNDLSLTIDVATIKPIREHDKHLMEAVL